MTIGNINFSTLNTGNSSLTVRAVSTSKNHLMSTANLLAEDGDPITACINAVEIDWNGAILENADIENGASKTINTTADLLELINEMQKEIYVIGAAVIASA